MTDQIAQLRQAASRQGVLIALHYACESLHDATDQPPAVTCIVTQRFDGRSVSLFSLTDSSPDTDKAAAEISLLERFFEYARTEDGACWIHWNMSRVSYGFEALSSRYRFLTGKPPTYSISIDMRFDLDDLIAAEFGDGYADHPRLYKLAALNRLSRRYALDGKTEAELRQTGDLGRVDRSIEEKAGWVRSLAELLLAGRLDTLNSAGRVPFAGTNLDAVAVVCQIAQRQLLIQRELRHRYSGRPTLEVGDEYDAQDLMRSLLRLFFDDIRPEEWTPEYAGGSSRIDFVLPAVGMAVELKHTRQSLDDRKLGEELIVDVARYAVHPSVVHLVCVVFDHDGHIANPRGLESDLGSSVRQENLAVTVIIVDR